MSSGPDTATIEEAGRVRRAYDAHGLRLAKYLTGSIIAMIVSTVTFTATFGPGILGSKGASLTASATGAIANYFLNRRWAWGKRGRAHVRRELVPYATTVIITAVAAAVITSTVNSIVRNYTDHRGIRTVLNTIAFLGTYGISFAVKYGIFNRLFGTKIEAIEAKHGDAPGPTERTAA